MASMSKKSTTKKTATKQSSKKKAVSKMGRPKKVIDQRMFEEMCKLQCTRDEVCAVLGVQDDTLNRWCKETYDGRTFSAVFSEKRENGKMSLRRKQFALAETSAAMAIFLGKNYLGQTDKVETKVEFADDGFIEALKGQASDTFKNAGDVVEE